MHYQIYLHVNDDTFVFLPNAGFESIDHVSSWPEYGSATKAQEAFERALDAAIAMFNENLPEYAGLVLEEMLEDGDVFVADEVVFDGSDGKLSIER